MKVSSPAAPGLLSPTKVIVLSVHSLCGLLTSACSDPPSHAPPTPYTAWLLLPTPDALGPPPAGGHWATSGDAFGCQN